MPDDASGNSPGTDSGTRGQRTWGEDPFAVVIQAPIIDEQSGRWVVESSAEPDTTPTTSDSASPPAQRDGTSSQTSRVSWDSGLRESGDAVSR